MPDPIDPNEEQNPAGDPAAQTELDTLKAKAAQADVLAEKLAKLEAKDTNFERFRNKTESEKQEFFKSMTEKERLQMDYTQSVEKELQDYKVGQMDQARNTTLNELAGNDADLRKSIENTEKEFIGKALSPQDLKDRLIKSATLVLGKKPQINPLFAYSPSSDHSAPMVADDKKGFVHTDAGKAMYKQMFGVDPK